jgi:PAS domain S-box-containing protein
VGSAVELKEKRGVDYLLIEDEEEGEIKGVVTSHELVGYPSSRLLVDCKIKPIATIAEETRLNEALKVLEEKEVNFLVVLNREGSPIGVINKEIIISFLYQEVKKSNKEKEREITERKRADEKLRKEKLFTENALNNLLDNFSVLDLEGRFIRWNKRVNEVTGYSDKEISSMKFTDLFREEDTKRLFAGMERMMKGEQARDEVTLVTRDGRHIPYELFGSLIKDSEGKPVNICGIGRDITERKRAEEVLQKITHELGVLLSTVPAMFFWIDEEGNFIRVNEAFAAALHKSPDEVKGKSLFDLYPEDMARKCHNDNLEVMKSGTAKRYSVIEEPVETPAGIMWVSTDKTPYRDENGNIIGVVGFSVDITERKRAEKLLRNAEEDWRNSFNSLEDIMLIIDRDYNIETINEIGLKLLGKSKEEVIGKKCYQIISGANSPAEECPCMKSLETKKVESYDRYEERLGKYFSIKSSPIFDDNGEIIKLVDLRRDITERKRVEDALQKAHDELERRVKERTTELVKANEQLKQEISERKKAEEERERFLKELKAKSTELEKAIDHMVDLEEMTRMKTDFLSITSHELRTPLTPMKSQLQMLQEGYTGELNKKQEKSIEVVLRNLTRLENLIGDILEISRIEAGRVKLSFDSMNINDAVKEAIKMQEAFAKEKNIEISAKLAEMPNIIGDAERLGQAIGNLLNNAIKFSEKTGKVIIETKRLGENVQFSITDYGIGISKADQKKLFTPFSQIDSSMGREHDGTGLGLAIVKGIIHAHNGKVWSESELEKGSTFCFVIPTKQKITEKEASYIG